MRPGASWRCSSPWPPQENPGAQKRFTRSGCTNALSRRPPGAVPRPTLSKPGFSSTPASGPRPVSTNSSSPLVKLLTKLCSVRAKTASVHQISPNRHSSRATAQLTQRRSPCRAASLLEAAVPTKHSDRLLSTGAGLCSGCVNGIGPLSKMRRRGRGIGRTARGGTAASHKGTCPGSRSAVTAPANDRDAVLERLPFLAQLEPSLRDLVVGLFQSRAFAFGDTIVAQGDAADGMYVLASGSARALVVHEGKEITLASCKRATGSARPHSSTGPRGLRLSEPRNPCRRCGSTASCSTPSSSSIPKSATHSGTRRAWRCCIAFFARTRPSKISRWRPLPPCTPSSGLSRCQPRRSCP